ncbi:LysR family transcriptional regulator [Antarctobacter heliothermus]|uniref:DNA-binding transcriptional regulator, LysR family n=1 Tax=Antarctobacter heliothermus TaxID=74033 RepID=A0A239KG03_9RHOB|nr:LysR family transcriptional regulator [Antarctobacter heliothermus]SNT16579.1 DNA-binding transcriptional regulator, LysR family [Antarctobacter heliothermus]
METRNLETLVAVSETGSLAGAAKKLNVTSTAVAQRIRALESEIGAPLVTRSGRTVQPTSAGYAVLARAEGLLSEYRKLRAAVTGADIAGSLKVGAISTALTGVLPDTLVSLSRTHPEVRVFLEPGTSADLYERVVAGHLDAAAIIRPAFDLPKSLEFETWRHESFVLIVPRDETRNDVAAILGDRPYIRYDRRQWGGRLPQAWLDRIRIEPDVRYELDALDAIAVLVGRGLGVSIVPDWAGPRPAGTMIRAVLLPDPAPFREIGLVWPRSSPRAALVETVMAAVRQTAGQDRASVSL